MAPFPWVRVRGPLVINTAIFIGSALVQKALGVDILPIVNWVPGHPEGGCGGQLCILGGFGWVHICMYNGNTKKKCVPVFLYFFLSDLYFNWVCELAPLWVSHLCD